MAKEFEVSVRSIYRDIDELSAAGIPVISQRGPGGGFKLRDGYRTKLNGLSPSEADALLLIGLARPVAQLGLGSAIISVERKLLAALPKDLTARAMQAKKRIHLDAVDWYREIERPTFLLVVASAMWSYTKLEIQYEGWTRRGLMIIEPYGLVIKAGVWYVVARLASKLRTFKVGQIRECRHCADTFVMPKAFDLVHHWTEATTRFEEGLLKRSAVVRFAPEAMLRIDRLGTRAAKAARSALPDRHGWRTATVPIEESDHSLCELFGLGPYIEVLEPAELRARALHFAQRFVEQHQLAAKHRNSTS